jgi:hypothetical protein
LRVKLASLDFHALRADGSGLSGPSQLGFSVVVKAWCLPHSTGVFGKSCDFNLNPINSVDTVEEKNQDEDECDLPKRVRSVRPGEAGL